MKLPTALSAALLCTVSARAGDAFFSTDGATVTFVPRFESGQLWRLEVAAGKLTALPLGAELKSETPGGVARGAEGETLFTAGKSAWVLKPDGTPKRVCDLGTAIGAEGLFVGVKPGTPVTDWLFVSASGGGEDGRREFFARKPGTKSFDGVFCRRVRNAEAGCFADDGRLFFVSDGDVWEGEIAPDEDLANGVGVLTGARVAPLALLNTDSANAGSMFVRSLEAAGPWLYAGLAGRHMGCILRMPLPAQTLYDSKSKELPDPKTQIEAMRASLEKTELIVADTGGLSAFAACEVNGRPLVFYRGEGPELFLWNGSGAPKQIAEEPR
jgi:hypothetical protein